MFEIDVAYGMEDGIIIRDLSDRIDDMRGDIEFYEKNKPEKAKELYRKIKFYEENKELVEKVVKSLQVIFNLECVGY